MAGQVMDRSGWQGQDAAGGGHAVVIGDSMAGLLAARALANHVARVTVVERDRFPDGPVTRKGAPQAYGEVASVAPGSGPATGCSQSTATVCATSSTCASIPPTTT